MIILRRSVLVLMASAVAAGAMAQVLWLKVEGSDRAFTVEMPGTPEYKIVDQLHTYSLVRGPIEYVVQNIEIFAAPPRHTLQMALDSAAPHLVGGKWQSIEWREVQGLPAADATGVLERGGTLRNLLVLKGGRLVSLGMRGPAGTTRFPDAERFFGSLRFAP